MSQRSFASAEYALKKKRTRREKFLDEMERIVPWMRLIGVIEPLYPTSGRVGRQPIGVAKMFACIASMYGPDAFCKRSLVMRSWSAYMYTACLLGSALHARSLDEIRASGP